MTPSYRQLVRSAHSEWECLWFPLWPRPAGQPKAAALDFAKRAEVSDKCVVTGLACVSHCQKELQQGNKMMAECLQGVLEVLVACKSLEKLARYDSDYTKDFAKVTAKI